MKKIFCLLLAAAALAAAVAGLCFLRAGGGAESAPAPGEGPRPPRALEKVRPKSVRPASARRGKPLLRGEEPTEEDESMTPEERQLDERIEAALEKEDLEQTIACAADAQRCGSAEVRRDMVDALGWFGARALPELTMFLADADEDVRESARTEWQVAVAEIEDERERVAAVGMAMSALTDEDFLDDISGEYIGVDEKTAVESLVCVIEAGESPAGVAKAKETYEFITGEEYAGRAAAEKWIAEEYQPPEEPAPEG